MPSDELSFVERFPRALAANTTGAEDGAVYDDGTPANSARYGNAASSEGTRSDPDENLYLAQDDIDARRAAGMDVTRAQAALDELWTRRFEGVPVTTLDTVHVRPSPEDSMAYQDSQASSRFNYSAVLDNVLGSVGRDRAGQPTPYWQQPIAQRIGLQETPMVESRSSLDRRLAGHCHRSASTIPRSSSRNSR